MVINGIVIYRYQFPNFMNVATMFIMLLRKAGQARDSISGTETLNVQLFVCTL